MYPYLRLARTLIKTHWKPRLTLTDISIIPMRVCLTDIDPFWELNNGRHLTMMDFGRFEMTLRTGLFKVLKENKWGVVVAGSSVRYRHRLKLFQKYFLHTRLVGADEKWIYFHQKTVRNGKIHSAALIRTAVTSANGIVKVNEVSRAMGYTGNELPMPEWIKAWVEADELRPWTID